MLLGLLKANKLWVICDFVNFRINLTDIIFSDTPWFFCFEAFRLRLLVKGRREKRRQSDKNDSKIVCSCIPLHICLFAFRKVCRFEYCVVHNKCTTSEKGNEKAPYEDRLPGNKLRALSLAMAKLGIDCNKRLLRVCLFSNFVYATFSSYAACLPFRIFSQIYAVLLYNPFLHYILRWFSVRLKLDVHVGDSRLDTTCDYTFVHC